jgi:hypothetical protein
MTVQDYKKVIINNGITNLKEYGYPNVDKDNIFSDALYSAFFKGMLEDNLSTKDKVAKKAITELLNEIKAV